MKKCNEHIYLIGPENMVMATENERTIENEMLKNAVNVVPTSS